MIRERYRNLELHQLGHTLFGQPIVGVIVRRRQGGALLLHPRHIPDLAGVVSLFDLEQPVCLVREAGDLAAIRAALAQRAELMRQRIGRPGARYPQRQRQQTTLTCLACGQTFTPKHRNYRLTYCSSLCWARHTAADRAMRLIGRRQPPAGCIHLEDVAERVGYTGSGLRHLIRRVGLPVVQDQRGTWMRLADYEAARATGVFGSAVGGPKGPRPVPPGYINIEQAAARLGKQRAWTVHLLRRAGLPLIRERGALFVEAVAFERMAGERGAQ